MDEGCVGGDAGIISSTAEEPKVALISAAKVGTDSLCVGFSLAFEFCQICVGGIT